MSATALKACADQLRSLFQDCGVPVNAVSTWPDVTRVKTSEPLTLPVQTHMDRIIDQAPSATMSVLKHIADTQSLFQWGQTYTEHEASRAFLDQYGWAEIIGRKGPIASGALAVGLLLLGPDTEYPLHAHPANEYYIPLSGTADWYTDDTGWQTRPPLALIHHASGIRHGMRTKGAPMLAVYLWFGDLQTVSVFSNP